MSASSLKLLSESKFGPLAAWDAVGAISEVLEGGRRKKRSLTYRTFSLFAMLSAYVVGWTGS